MTVAHSITSSTTAFIRALDQPSGGRTAQNRTPLFGPTCLLPLPSFLFSFEQKSCRLRMTLVLIQRHPAPDRNTTCIGLRRISVHCGLTATGTPEFRRHDH